MGDDRRNPARTPEVIVASDPVGEVEITEPGAADDQAEDERWDPRVVRRGPSTRLLLAGGAAVVAAAMALVFTGGGSDVDDEDDRASDEAATADDPRAATNAAADWLEEAGTFSFEAQVQTSGPDEVFDIFALDDFEIRAEEVLGSDLFELRRGDEVLRLDVAPDGVGPDGVAPDGSVRRVVVLGVSSTELHGEVRLPGPLRQLAGEPPTAVREEILVDGEMWRRSALPPDELAEALWIPLGDVATDPLDPFGAHLLPRFLEVAADQREITEPGRDERLIEARFPDEALPASDAHGPLRDGAIQLTMAPNDRPTQITVSAASADGETGLSSTYDITAIGGPVTIEPPHADR